MDHTAQRQPCPRNRVRGMEDMDMTFTPTLPFADGFSMNSALKYLPNRTFPLMLSQLDELRENAHNYRARWLALPLDPTIAIVAFESFVATQNIYPGSILWGYNFAALDGTAADFEIQIGDVCAGTVYFEDSVDATALRPTTATDLYPVIKEPRFLYGNPNPKLRITITNKTAGDKRCQLLLHLAELCTMTEGV